MMVYNTQNRWVIRFCPSSAILETRKYSVSKTESVSIFRWGGRKHLLSSFYGQWLRLTLSKGSNWVEVSLPFTWGRKRIQFPKRFLSSLENIGRWTKSEKPVLCDNQSEQGDRHHGSLALGTKGNSTPIIVLNCRNKRVKMEGRIYHWKVQSDRKALPQYVSGGWPARQIWEQKVLKCSFSK
jgi:hypothetical protein